MTVFIKRFPSRGELPKKDSFYLTNKGKLHTDNFKSWFVEYWLEEIELPSKEEIENMAEEFAFPNSVKIGANFILNHIKGDLGEK